jgi:hypothetical protein
MRLWIAALIFLAVLGLLLILVGGDVLIPIGIVFMGGAAVGAVSLGFFAVGRSEDRAREAEAAARGRADHRAAASAVARRLVANVNGGWVGVGAVRIGISFDWSPDFGGVERNRP